MDALARHKKSDHGEESTGSPLRISMKRSNKRSLSEPKSKRPRLKIGSISSDNDDSEDMDNDDMTEPIDLAAVESKISNKLLLDTTSDYSQYRLAKVQLNYLLRENEMLQDEYNTTRKKLKRLRTERRVLLEAAMTYDPQDD